MTYDGDEIYNDNQLCYSPLSIKENYLCNQSFYHLNEEEIFSRNFNQPTKPNSDDIDHNNIVLSRKGILFYSDDNKKQNTNLDDNNINIKERNLNEITNKKKKRRRKKKIENGREIHNSLSLDNMRNNFKIWFFKFIIDFFNCIIKKMFLYPKINSFKYINCKDKNNQNQKDLNKQFNMRMKQILSLQIGKKYKNFKPSHNDILMKKIEKKLNFEKYKCYEKLFTMYLFEFYKEIYLLNDKETLKKQYSLNDKVNFFIDNILKSNKNKDYIIKYINMASTFLQFAGIEKNKINLTNILNIIKNNNNEDTINNKNEKNNTLLKSQSFEIDSLSINCIDSEFFLENENNNNF